MRVWALIIFSLQNFYHCKAQEVTDLEKVDEIAAGFFRVGVNKSLFYIKLASNWNLFCFSSSGNNLFSKNSILLIKFYSNSNFQSNWMTKLIDIDIVFKNVHNIFELV